MEFENTTITIHSLVSIILFSLYSYIVLIIMPRAIIRTVNGDLRVIGSLFLSQNISCYVSYVRMYVLATKSTLRLHICIVALSNAIVRTKRIKMVWCRWSIDDGVMTTVLYCNALASSSDHRSGTEICSTALGRRGALQSLMLAYASVALHGGQ